MFCCVTFSIISFVISIKFLKFVANLNIKIEINKRYVYFSFKIRGI
nr:MAG TPA: hypothetical protein [Caudoviricetes sp.]